MIILRSLISVAQIATVVMLGWLAGRAYVAYRRGWK